MSIDRRKCCALLLLAAFPAAAATIAGHLENRTKYIAPRAIAAPIVDGVANDAVWARARWQEVRYRWLGPEIGPADFSGRYKVAWTERRIYILFEFVDDVLIDSHRDPLVQYWDDDSLEIFVDEDYSGGNHQYSHNAFAYHFSLDNRAIDIGPDKKAHDYSHHVDSRWRQRSDGITWEVALSIFDDTYDDEARDNEPVSLSHGKLLGLMVAYCDNDGSEVRENFIGSEQLPEDARNRGWIDAGLFGELHLGE